MFIGFMFKISLDQISKQGWIAWTLVDYARHRKKFKAWLKQKRK